METYAALKKIRTVVSKVMGNVLDSNAGTSSWKFVARDVVRNGFVTPLEYLNVPSTRKKKPWLKIKETLLMTNALFCMFECF